MEHRPYRRKRQKCRFPEWPRRGATLPWFRAGGGLLFAARSRHEKPYPPMSKSNFAFPFTVPSKGNAEKYTPFPRPTQAESLEVEVSRAVWDVNAWDVTYEPPLAFVTGRFGVLEIGRKLQKRLRTSKPPHLQAAKAKRCFATASSVLFRQTARRDASPHRSPPSLHDFPMATESRTNTAYQTPLNESGSRFSDCCL